MGPAVKEFREALPGVKKVSIPFLAWAVDEELMDMVMVVFGMRRAQINYLFMSVGKFELSTTFTNNGEGLDVGYALNFYGRWKFFFELLPLLQAASDAGEEVRVVSVLAAGEGGKLDREDLGLRENWSIARSFSQGCTYTSLLIEVRPPLTEHDAFQRAKIPLTFPSLQSRP